MVVFLGCWWILQTSSLTYVPIFCDVVGFSQNCDRRLRLPRLKSALRCCDLQNFTGTLAAAHSSPTTDRRRRQDARKVLRSHTAHRGTDQKSECQCITPNNEQQPHQTTDRCSSFSGSPSHHLQYTLKALYHSQPQI